MTEEEIARYELVLREADRIRQEIALEEIFYAGSEGSPNQMINEMEYSQEDIPLLAA